MLKQILIHEARNMVKSRWLIVYSAMLLLLSGGLLEFSENSAKLFSSLVAVITQFIPLATMIMGIVTYHGSKDFIIMLLAMPQKRSGIFWGVFLGLALPIVVSICVGIAVPALLLGEFSGAYLVMIGGLIIITIQLALIFLGIAVFLSIVYEDRGKALGLGFLIWLLFSVVYDALILTAAVNFSDYPLEIPVMFFCAGNPIDTARVLLLLHSDSVAMMGYTGRVFQQFLGSTAGFLVLVIISALWTVVPLWLGKRLFMQRDY